MLRLIIICYSLIGIGACASASNIPSEQPTTSFKSLAEQCYIGSTSDGIDSVDTNCKHLDGTHITIDGILQYKEHHAQLFALDTKFSSVPFNNRHNIALLGKKPILKKLHNKIVRVSGMLRTNCVSIGIENKRAMQQESPQNTDTIIIRMATGHCHYIGNKYFTNYEVKPLGN